MTGLKDVHHAKVGDTITLAGKARRRRAAARLPRTQADGLVGPVPGRRAATTATLREALDKLKLSDSALVYEPETSHGARVRVPVSGSSGCLHMDIVRERLEREFDLELISTAPNVEFHVFRGTARRSSCTTPPRCRRAATTTASRSRSSTRRSSRPSDYLGAVFELCQAPARRDGRHGVPHARTRRGPLRLAARRDRLRLLRPAEVAHARVRDPRLRALGLPGGEAGARRRPAPRRAGRRVHARRAPRQGLRVRQADDRAA